jgi:hypothetical protein
MFKGVATTRIRGTVACHKLDCGGVRVPNASKPSLA